MPDKSVAQKLLIKEGYRVLLVNPPPGYAESMGELPKAAVLVAKAQPEIDFIQLFVTTRKHLEDSLPMFKKSLKPNGLLWVSYPKGTSKVRTDINRDTINTYANTLGLQGVAMISVDDTWSALRLRPAA
jgi:predicted CoA-binding protein